MRLARTRREGASEGQASTGHRAGGRACSVPGPGQNRQVLGFRWVADPRRPGLVSTLIPVPPHP